jgi:cyclic pyranopterin phosphate synthase
MPTEHFPGEFAFLPHQEILTFEEITRLVGIFTGLGVDKVRVTGGEPLVRRGLPSLVAGLRAVPGVRDLALTTNGALLGGLARPLRDAGLDRLTVSLDALDPGRFQAMAGAPVHVEDVLKGLEAALEAGFPPPRLNCVLRRGVNEADILPLAEFARGNGCTLRFIEFMDVGTRNGWRMDSVVPGAQVAALLGSRWPLEPLPAVGPLPVAQRWRYLDGRGEVGLINSVTAPFCAGCDRARLSAEGRLHTCLFASEGLDLKGHLRSGATDADLAALVRARWTRRDDRYSELRTGHTPSPPRVEMNRMGG